MNKTRRREYSTRHRMGQKKVIHFEWKYYLYPFSSTYYIIYLSIHHHETKKGSKKAIPFRWYFKWKKILIYFVKLYLVCWSLKTKSTIIEIYIRWPLILSAIDIPKKSPITFSSTLLVSGNLFNMPQPPCFYFSTLTVLKNGRTNSSPSSHFNYSKV